jgi:hypothetical protein
MFSFVVPIPANRGRMSENDAKDERERWNHQL